MSWLSHNYEKAALGGAVVVALALSYAGWNQINAVADDFADSLAGGGKNDPSVLNADAVPKAIASFALDRSWTPEETDGRTVDLFTGIPLFVSRDAPDKAVDLLKDGPVHPPIPNLWWLENHLDPGFADAPSQDPDADGITNIEEHSAKTDPNDEKAHPPLIAKLKYIRDESLVWVIRPGFQAGQSFTFRYEDGLRRQNNAGADAMVAPGDLFFKEGVMKERFKLIDSEVVKELNNSINEEVDVTYVRIEDQRPNKNKEIYRFPAPLSDGRKKDHLKYDRTAIFSLEAIGLAGEEFKVEENTAFALPPSAGNKDFLLKKVTPEEVIVEYKDSAGVTQSATISKGALPADAP